MNDNLAELLVWCTSLVCGTVLVVTHHPDFGPILIGLFAALAARGMRATLRPREVVKQLQDEHREKSGLIKLPPEDANVR